MSWTEIDPTELNESQRVRQGPREGSVLGWHWLTGRRETVVDVLYDSMDSLTQPGDWTQWVVREGATVLAWVPAEITLPRQHVRV